MNFLAHLYLAGDDENLRLGALLGDFVRGNEALRVYPPGLQHGIRLHRHIDAFTDAMPAVMELRRWFRTPFRRFGGIIIDHGLDYELARNWDDYSPLPLDGFDRDVRSLLDHHENLVPAALRQFMNYADRRGLFAAYRQRDEVLHSLKGIGKRISRPNPLGRVSEVWGGFEPLLAGAFPPLFDEVQSEVSSWLNSKSTTTGS